MTHDAQSFDHATDDVMSVFLHSKMPARRDRSSISIPLIRSVFRSKVSMLQSIGPALCPPALKAIRRSFSAAKTFELPLYTGTPAKPVVFDRPGVVTLGCNIHDWMLGYVYVLETPYFATTGSDGNAELNDLPAGAYEVRVWQPRMRETGEPPSQRVTVTGSKAGRVEFLIALKPEFRLRRAPIGAGDRYR